MHVWILPISGGGFVAQCAALSRLCECGMRPDIVLCTSGGCIATLITLAGQWTKQGILRVSGRLSSDLLFKPWSQISIFSSMIGFFKGSLHRTGPGVSGILRDYFTEKTIDEIEIWTGCYNQVSRKSALFCNKARGTTTLQPELDNYLDQTLPISYAGCKLDVICEYMTATASVPVVVEGRKLHGLCYVDGGLGGASPFLHLQPAIEKVCDGKLHITYVSSENFNLSMSGEPADNVIGNWKSVTQCLTRQMVVIDRRQAVRTIPEADRCHVELEATQENLRIIMAFREYCARSVLELYPEEDGKLDYASFKGEAAVDYISKARVLANFWWQRCGTDPPVAPLAKGS